MRDVIVLRRYLGKGLYGPSVCLRDEDGKTLPANASLQAIMRAYARAVQTENAPRTLRWLLEYYLASPRFRRLAPKTQKLYRGYAGRIAEQKLQSGGMFGDVPLEKIIRPVIARYRDSRSDAPTAVNREMQFLSAVFSWALEQGYIRENPVQGVERNPEKPRDRYVEDWEYDLVHGMATPLQQVLMELAYLCRARRGELLTLEPRVHLLAEGIHLKRTKGSESEITLWSPRLEQAVALAKSHNRNTVSRWLLHDKRGGQIRDSTLDTAWQRLMARAMKAGLRETFTFHDIKAKGITDHTEHHGGHRSAKMRETYVRRPDKIEPTR